MSVKRWSVDFERLDNIIYRLYDIDPYPDSEDREHEEESDEDRLNWLQKIYYKDLRSYRKEFPFSLYVENQYFVFGDEDEVNFQCDLPDNYDGFSRGSKADARRFYSMTGAPLIWLPYNLVGYSDKAIYVIESMTKKGISEHIIAYQLKKMNLIERTDWEWIMDEEEMLYRIQRARDDSYDEPDWELESYLALGGDIENYYNNKNYFEGD